MAENGKDAKADQKAAAAVTCPPVFGMKPEKGRWMFVVLGLIMNICLGTVYSWSVFTADLSKYFQSQGHITLSSIQLNMPFLVFLAFFAILMPVAGRFFNKYNPKTILVTGSVLVGIGWLVAGRADPLDPVAVRDPHRCADRVPCVRQEAPCDQGPRQAGITARFWRG